MSIIVDMASEDRRRRSCSQSSSKVEAPSPISIATPAPLSEGPALAGPSEVGLSEAGPSEMDSSGIIVFFI